MLPPVRQLLPLMLDLVLYKLALDVLSIAS